MNPLSSNADEIHVIINKIFSLVKICFSKRFSQLFYGIICAPSCSYTDRFWILEISKISSSSSFLTYFLLFLSGLWIPR